MGLMDRDYYREKTKRKESLIEKLKRNPLAIVVAIILILFFLSLIT